MALAEAALGHPISIDPRWRSLGLGVTLLALAAVFLLDWHTPRVVGIPILYIAILWTSLWWAAPSRVVAIAVIASVLALSVNPAPHASEWVPDGVSRIVAVMGLWSGESGPKAT